MREIKFRIWNKKIEVMSKTFSLKQRIIIEKGEIVMQFTGIKDKNGKEIYEGDIIKYSDALFIVVWFEDCGQFYLDKITQDNIVHDIRMNRLDVYAVLKGNIYENPELLEGKS